MLIPRGGGRGTLQLDRLGLCGRLDLMGLIGLMGLMGLLGRMGPGIGAFLDTVPGDVARGLARKRSPAERPGRKVAVSLRRGLRAIPLARSWHSSTGIGAYG
jgi:hypothetical protein